MTMERASERSWADMLETNRTTANITRNEKSILHRRTKE